MDISYIKKIIKLVENSDVDEVEIEEEGKKVRVAKNRPQPMAYQFPIPTQIPALNQLPLASSVAAPAQLTSPSAASEEKAKAEKKHHEVRSPIVGTFYRAPSPDAEPYVEVGQEVKVGDVMCIVEAMKLMNEIESDVAGKIVKIMVENAKPVEYNQVLFLVDPA